MLFKAINYAIGAFTAKSDIISADGWPNLYGLADWFYFYDWFDFIQATTMCKNHNRYVFE